MLIDNLFDADVDELIAVCGDFNADLDDVLMGRSSVATSRIPLQGQIG